MTGSIAASGGSRVSPRTVGIALAVLGVAAITGVLTPYGMSHLPRSIEAAANSSAPWAMLTFASVYLARVGRMYSAVLGAASFVVMDACFFAAYDLRGGYYPHHYLAFWLGIAIVIGPLVGLCASWLRSPRAVLRAIAVAAPTSILVGEGAFMLARLPGLSTPYAISCVVVGVVLFAVLAGWRLRRAWPIVVSLAMCTAASAAFFAIYGLLPIVLHKVVP